MNVILDEEERQVVLLALARLAAERPGWEPMLTDIARKVEGEGSVILFSYFLLMRRKQISNSLPEVATEPLLKQALGL